MSDTVTAFIADTQALKKRVREGVSISEDRLRESMELTDAYRMCLQVSGKEIKQVAQEIDMPYGDLTRVLRKYQQGADRRYMPHDKIIPFMAACGNSIPLQWLMLQWRDVVGVKDDGSDSIEMMDLKDRLESIETRLDDIFNAVRKPVSDGCSLMPSDLRPVWLLLELCEAEMEVIDEHL